MEALAGATAHATTRTIRLPGRALRSTMAALALGLAIAGTAQAYTIPQRTNVPVLPTIYKVQGAHYDIGNPVSGPMLRPWVFQSGPVVNRVAPTGAQTVQVTYTVERWNGSTWPVVATQSGAVTIAANQVSAKAPNLSILPSQGAGSYRVRLAIVWTSEIGAVLGSMKASMSSSGDYVCSTTGPCTVGAGYVTLG